MGELNLNAFAKYCLGLTFFSMSAISGDILRIHNPEAVSEIERLYEAHKSIFPFLNLCWKELSSPHATIDCDCGNKNAALKYKAMYYQTISNHPEWLGNSVSLSSNENQGIQFFFQMESNPTIEMIDTLYCLNNVQKTNLMGKED